MTARRSRGEGSVFFDKARRCWAGVLDVGADPDTGRRRRRKVSAPTKTECREKLAELREDYRKAGTIGRRDVTVRQLVDAWLASPPESVRAEQSLENYTDTGHRICDGARGVRGIGSIPAARLTAADVERLLAGLAGAGYAATTIRQTRSLLRWALRRAQHSGTLSRNAAELADLPRGGKTRKSRAMTAAQVGALLALDLSAWWRAWIVTAVATGLRPGELSGLRWEDADFAEGLIRVRQSMRRQPGRMAAADLKTAESKRTMVMPEMVAVVLRVLRTSQAADRLKAGAAWEDHGLVFAGHRGRPRWPQAVRADFRRLCEQAGIGGWQLRETRHTFVSALSDSGVDIERIADAVGHVNSHITRTVYRHSLADKITETSAAMDRIYPPGDAR